MVDPENGERWLVSDIAKTTHSAEINLYNICYKILNGICNTSWRTGGFVFLTLADDCVGHLLSIVMTLLRGEIGSL